MPYCLPLHVELFNEAYNIDTSTVHEFTTLDYNGKMTLDRSQRGLSPVSLATDTSSN